MDPANDFWALRRRVGPAVWLLAFFAAYTPAGWTGDTPAYIAQGNIISDGELADRLQISIGTLASWRRRLRKAHLLDWLVRPGVGRVYIISALNKVLPKEQVAIQEVSQSVQTALRSAEGNAGFVN
ncbi:MAG: hypothetical protein DMG32_18965 [Acidobacteria bacterium]|nr:MAG: hypothetical protein DMG32_18965 [Acidobacteriota bacterium]